jgi:hypothetical protein
MKVQVVSLDQWQAFREWPSNAEFCLVVVADRIMRGSAGYDELIRGAIQSGARSIYFWGPQADNASDIAVFSIAEFEVMTGTILEKAEKFMTVPFSKATASEAVELIRESYMPEAVTDKHKATLVICGLRGAASMNDFCDVLKRSVTSEVD